MCVRVSDFVQFYVSAEKGEQKILQVLANIFKNKNHAKYKISFTIKIFFKTLTVTSKTLNFVIKLNFKTTIYYI